MRKWRWATGRAWGAGVLVAGFSLYTSLAFSVIPLPSTIIESQEGSPEISEKIEAVSQPRKVSALDRAALEAALAKGSATRESYLEFFEGEARLGSPRKLRDLESALEEAQELLDGAPAMPEDVLQVTENIEVAIEEIQNYFDKRSRLRSVIRKEVAPGVVGIYASDPQSNEVIVSVNPDLEFTSASLYKLFVAYSMMRAVETGEWSWADPLLGSWSLERCFDEMIIYSDNDCPVEWLDRVGVERVDSQIKGLGLENSQVVWSDMVTTAQDMGHFLELIYFGDIVDEVSLERLAKAMENQEYREGMPDQLDGVTVLNKVGFLEDLLHDAGIVRSKKGDLVLVILTSGSSWETIAEVAATIYNSL
ncbi:serine hydrolase [Actinomyces minihominis]|uniref:serine hydrolase n=1 Tax=Actinomyces minihominis TaxID=2002838 RepID=UPI00101ADBF5|nr:serine hydrolase [Actinomyces minihominis]